MTINDRRLVEVAIIAVVAVVTGLDVWWNAPGTRQADAVTYLLLAVSVAALLGRRRAPLVAAAACGAAYTGWLLLGHHGELLGLPAMVALYTVAERGDRRRTVVVGAVAVAWSALVAGLPAGDWSPVAEVVWPAAALLLGEVVRGRRELRHEYAARQAQAERAREREAHRRVAEERLRIAREVHDVVAHTMAGVNVQVGVAVAALDARPDAARAALREAHTAGREAMGDLRAAVAVLRDPAGNEATVPAPRLSQLDELVDAATRAGITVTVHRHTGDTPLPGVVEVAAYRIVQEALTNVIRHAGASAATVSLTRQNGDVIVEVADDGPRPAAPGPAPPPGHGLVGMAERAAALGGRVAYGPAPGGGFRVCATLPVGGGAR